MPSPTDPSNQLPYDADLDVRGAVPSGLSGHFVGIARDAVHSFQVHSGRVSYLARSIPMGAAVKDLVAFDGTILTYGDDSSVRQLINAVGTPLRVDLAGQRRTIAACPTYDAASGELHLVASDSGGAQMHVVVPAGALTRRSRSIVDAHWPIRGLAIGSDHLVFVAAGVVGVAPRDGEARVKWVPTDVAAPRPIHTYQAGDTFILLVLTPSLERWILHPDSGAVEREVLDPTARRFVHLSGEGVDGAPRWLWTTGDDTISRHDLVDSRHAHHSLRACQPGDFVVVPDAERPDHVDGGWFVGLVHDPATTTTDLCVCEVADIAGPAIATVRIPQRVPLGLRCTWIPSTQQ